MANSFWATITGSSITAEPISPAISCVVKDPDCSLGRDKSSTSNPCAFAPAQSPQLASRSGNHQMPAIETSMLVNNSKRSHAEMDSSDSGVEDNADGQDIWIIEYPRKPVASSSKQTRELWNKAQRHESPFRGRDQRKGALNLRYIVEPATWLGMQIYTEYNVSGVDYRKNDYVHVRPPDDNNRKFWVAHILEIRAEDACHIYALIAWMYWPDQLVNAHMAPEAPGSGRRWYHGKHELIASNHLDVVDITSMAGPASVAQWVEDDDDSTQEGYYWRQTFNVKSGVLSSIRKYCICDDYYNPDYTLLACPNEECRLWMHEGCIAINFKTKVYNALPANLEKQKHMGSTIKCLSAYRQSHNRFTGKNNGDKVHVRDSSTKKTATENLYCLKCSTVLG
ncbi:hypothetical protein V490_01579 [Pseudogymnoascus sp. VKM F-3557]|nr:hypothetical protein V490_01579 [Pseudogymnoascus sp. VKM F-3557]